MDFRIVALFLILVAVGVVNGNQHFTYTVTNDLEEPHVFINETIQLNIYNGRNLYNYMKDACIQDPDRFTNFTATYQPGGYFINAINGVFENWHHEIYWQVSNASGILGYVVSDLIPEANDEIVIELIQCQKITHKYCLINLN